MEFLEFYKVSFFKKEKSKKSATDFCPRPIEEIPEFRNSGNSGIPGIPEFRRNSRNSRKNESKALLCRNSGIPKIPKEFLPLVSKERNIRFAVLPCDPNAMGSLVCGTPLAWCCKRQCVLFGLSGSYSAARGRRQGAPPGGAARGRRKGASQGGAAGGRRKGSVARGASQGGRRTGGAAQGAPQGGAAKGTAGSEPIAPLSELS